MLFFSPYRYRGQLYSIIYGQAIPSVIGQKSVALTATTWEEINMLATQDKNIELAANKLYKLSKDQRIRDEIWAREDAIRQQIDFENYWKRELANRDAAIAEKDIVISNLMAEIEQLRKGN